MLSKLPLERHVRNVRPWHKREVLEPCRTQRLVDEPTEPQEA